MINDDYRPRPGDFFLAQSNGAKWWAYGLLQLLTGEPSQYTHAGIVLDDDTYIEARPGGACIKQLDTLWERRALAFSQNYLTDAQRAEIVKVSRLQVGRPYSWDQFWVLAGRRMHVKTGKLEQRVERTQGMICSQFVDYIYERANVELFADGRRPGDVSPGSLAHVGLLYHCRRQGILLPEPPQAAEA